MRIIGLDIGGANLKAADERGEAVTEPFALWRDPQALLARLTALLQCFPAPDALCITMTAELCDCFASKREGVMHILAAVEAVAGSAQINVWSTQGRFVTLDEARHLPLAVAAANWHALATCIARTSTASGHSPSADLLIDTGSTTTDIIALDAGCAAATGLTDTARLASGELVYIGGARTPLMALGPMIELDGRSFGVMAEFFASMDDVALLTGQAQPCPESTDTADGRPRVVEAAAARVARMIGADLEVISHAAAHRLASSFADRAVDRLADAARRATTNRGTPRAICITGSGRWLAKAAAQRAFPSVPLTSLDWTPAQGDAACAVALVKLAQDIAGGRSGA